MRLDDLHAGEECGQIGGDHLLDPDKHLLLDGDLAAAFAFGRNVDRHKLREGIGNLHTSEVLDALGVAQDDCEIQAEVGDVGKRTTGIECERRQRGENRVLKIAIGERLLLVAQVRKVLDADSGLAQCRYEFLRPAIVRGAVEADYRGANCAQLFGRSHRIGAALHHALFDLPLQTRHSHHEELVDV